jgi:hypothetical protein
MSEIETVSFIVAAVEYALDIAYFFYQIKRQKTMGTAERSRFLPANNKNDS